jgi:hypothetical protein
MQGLRRKTTFLHKNSGYRKILNALYKYPLNYSPCINISYPSNCTISLKFGNEICLLLFPIVYK